jgi:hypothetical protein
MTSPGASGEREESGEICCRGAGHEGQIPSAVRLVCKVLMGRESEDSKASDGALCFVRCLDAKLLPRVRDIGSSAHY